MTTPAIAETNEVLRFSIRTPQQLARRVTEVAATEYFIDGLLPAQSLSLVIGDSGLGKSPLLYQAATAVAAGIPFLSRPTRQGRVLYLDCENGIAQVDGIVVQVSKCLEIDAPGDLRLWNLNDSDERPALEALIKEAEPAWVIVDPLKAFYPDIENKSENVTRAYQELRRLMQAHNCSITGIHHIRKPSDDPDRSRPPLDGPNFREWFLQARGARELINGCDVRLGVDRSGWSDDHSKLILRGFARVRGDTSPIQLIRILDDDGEPMGFGQLSGVDLLSNPEQRAAYSFLPDRFRFKEATAVYRRSDQATTDFLNNCLAAGLLRKLEGRSGYEKIAAAPQAGVSGVSPPESGMSMIIN